VQSRGFEFFSYSAIMSPVNKSRISSSRLLFFCLCAHLAAPAYAQTAAPANNPLLPGPKPPDVSTEWKQLVGIYGKGEATVIVLERDGELIWQGHDGEVPVQDYEHSGFLVPTKNGPLVRASVQQGSDGNVTMLSVAPELSSRADSGTIPPHAYTTTHPRYLPRTDAGSDPAHFYHVTPTRPLDELREAALAAKPPQEPGPFREPDLVELITLDPAIHLDIRYAHSNNFLSTPIYSQARAFMQRPAAEALVRVLRKLQPLGYGILIHDAYRPWYVTKLFWDATPPEDHIFVADPAKGSRHNRGCAVDLTLYDLATGQPIEMPGLYDEMSPRSFPTFPGGTSLQRWHRDLLRRAMESEGFTVNEDEWWHFDYKDWIHYPILNVPFEDLSAGSPRS
jgi:D-alanyl-D-alanine dipeptidase